MNEKIALPTLIHLLAIASGDTRKQSEDFLKEFFALISDTLSGGEQVKVKDFGVFKTINVEARKSVNVSTGEEHIIPVHRKVVFVPSKEMASEVNEPFEMFETVELSNDFDPADVTDDDPETLEYLETEEIPVEESEDVSNVLGYPENTVPPVISREFEKETDTILPDSEGEPEIETEPATQPEPEIETEPATQPEPEIETESSTQPEPKIETEIATEPDPESEYSKSSYISAKVEDFGGTDLVDPNEGPVQSDRGERKSRFGTGFLVGFLSAVVLLALAFGLCCFFKIIPIAPSTEPDGNKKQVIAVTAPREVEIQIDSAETKIEVSNSDNGTTGNDVKQQVSDDKPDDTQADEVPTQPSDKKVYDTITKTRYLTTMAKQHYGNFNLWPYIYMENQSFLGHPDRIRPGTKVVIPPLSKYGVDPGNPADIAKAKKKGVEIYSKYK